VHEHQNEDQEISVESLIAEQRRHSTSGNRYERVVGTLLVSGLLKQRLAVLTDAAVGQLMFDHVWSELNLLGPESVIVEIASERLLHSSPVPVKNTKENLNQ
jgi:hypothetical protein